MALALARSRLGHQFGVRIGALDALRRSLLWVPSPSPSNPTPSPSSPPRCGDRCGDRIFGDRRPLCSAPSVGSTDAGEDPCDNRDGGVKVGLFDRLWSVKAPLKVRIFLWMALKRRILTSDILVKRGWSGDTMCRLCGAAAESADHLLVGCAEAKALLGAVVLNWQFIRLCGSVTLLWEHVSGLVGSRGRRERTGVAAVWWTIWLERNSRTFNDKTENSRQLRERAREFSRVWAEWCP